MENLKKLMVEHKSFSTVAVLGFIVFINCFGFPIYNFEKAWPTMITIEYLVIPILSCGCFGSGLALLFPEKRYVSILALFLSLVGVGLVCRYLLEFGEVSNTYNFTLPNILVHVVVMVVLTSISWLHAKKHSCE